MALPGLGYSGGSATHPGNFSLARQYAAGATSASAARKQGATYSFVDVVGEARKRRRLLLEQAIASGAVKPDQIGKNDLSILGSMNPQGQIQIGKYGGPTGHGFLDVLGNLGKDIWSTAVHLPGGLYTVGRAAAEDTGKGIWNLPQTVLHPGKEQRSAIMEDVVNPALKGYAYTYLGRGAPEGSTLLSRLAEHPLQPILDVATLASGGASAAARVGGAVSRVAEPGSTLARLGEAGRSLTSREGRAPLASPVRGVEGERFPELPREYTPRPLSKLGQRGLDLFIKTGDNENRYGRFVREREERRLTRKEQNIAQAEEFKTVSDSLEGLGDFAALDPSEQFALTLAQLGINTPGKIRAFQEMARDTTKLDDPKAVLELENRGISPEYVQQMQNIPKSVIDRVLNPSENMISAHQAWKARVKEFEQGEWGHEADAISQRHLDKQSEQLQPYLRDDETEMPPADYPIEPVYVPMEEARGFQRYTPRLPQRLISRIPGVSRTFDTEAEARFRRGPTDRASIRQVTRENLMVPKVTKGTHESSGQTFAAGAFRTDARLYLDHVARQARDVVDAAWKKEHLNRVALKEENGELVKVAGGAKGQFEAERRFGPDVVALPAEFPIAWFRAQVNYAKKFNASLETYLKQHGDEDLTDLVNDPRFEDFMGHATDADAEAFSAAHWGAMKRPQVVIPRSDFEYMKKFADLDKPFNSKVARFATRWMHRWRAATLAYMPRWAINTAIGSLVMNSIRGVNFNDYWIAQRLHKQGLLPEGVNLGHQAQLEFLEAAAPGYGASKAAQYLGDLGIRLPGGFFVQKVQDIENYFRRAQFVHNLRRERRLQRDASGRIVDLGDDEGAALGEIESVLKDHYAERFADTRSIAEALDDPKVIQRAIDETNKFMYNYAILGPTERRVVRQFIPFWGWYKFISEAAYRLPVEYPGRVNLIQALSNIGEEQEREFGPLPEWLKGAIPLSKAPLVGGVLKYLPTTGLNPFANIFNPLGPQGPIEGSIQLGQFNPLIQAGLQGFGFDTLSGDRVPISPESGVGESFFGTLYKNGHEVKPAEVGGAQRFLMSLARSFPEFRLSERYILNPAQGFGANYPESVPFIAPRPMGPADSGTAQPGIGTVAGLSLGIWPRSFNLQRYQQLYRDESKYAAKRQQKGVLRLRRKLSGVGR